MTDPGAPPTVAEVFHPMYMASERKFGFSTTLAELLQMDFATLRALYDPPAPDPDSPDFGRDGRAIAAEVGCAPDILAHLLRRCTPTT